MGHVSEEGVDVFRAARTSSQISDAVVQWLCQRLLMEKVEQRARNGQFLENREFRQRFGMVTVFHSSGVKPRMVQGRAWPESGFGEHTMIPCCISLAVVFGE
jgi:hypothetical protein